MDTRQAKITISLDEVNSSQVDAELHRQDVANRMAEHQEKIRINFGGSGEMLGAKGGFFRKAMVYMAIFGFVFSLLSWGIGERIFKRIEEHPWMIACQLIQEFCKECPNPTDAQFEQFFREAREKIKGQADNPYLQDDFWTQSEENIKSERKKCESEIKRLGQFYWVCIAALIGLGLSIAEACVSKNFLLAAKNAVLGTVLGGAGGWIVSLFINKLYSALGGGNSGKGIFTQLFARGIGWGVLGLFVAIAPGIIMKSWKKFFLGLLGGAIGGLLGGILFDLICGFTQSDSPARFIGIVALGVGAAVSMVSLENVAKRGWLKVAAGIITGKQFILYRNPTVIGSSPKCEIYLFKDPSVAPKHAAINSRNGDFILTAIEGATVLINNTPVRQQKLKSGDRVKVGQTIFIFEAKTIKKYNG